MNDLSNEAKQERNLMNSVEKLANKVTELDNLIGLSTKILRQFERIEPSSSLVESLPETKPMDKPDIIGVIDMLNERIDQVMNRTGKNLEQLSRMIG